MGFRLATAQAERVVADGRRFEVARVRIPVWRAASAMLYATVDEEVVGVASSHKPDAP